MQHRAPTLRDSDHVTPPIFQRRSLVKIRTLWVLRVSAVGLLVLGMSVWSALCWMAGPVVLLLPAAVRVSHGTLPSLLLLVAVVLGLVFPAALPILPYAWMFPRWPWCRPMADQHE